MDLFKVIVTTVLTTLVVITLGVVATSALWPESAQAHGFGALRGTSGMHGFGHRRHGGFAAGGNHCARFSPRHTQLLEAFVSIELGLDDNQEQALEPVIQAVDRWRADAVQTCENLSISTAPEGLDTVRQVLASSEQAISEIAPLFTAFYATLDDEQRAGLDGWVTHHKQQTEE